MISGSVSKLTEGRVINTSVIRVENDIVRIFGTGVTINTIMPGLGTAQGQFLILIPNDGFIKLGNTGNIIVSGGTNGGWITPNRLNFLMYVKTIQKWIYNDAVRETGLTNIPYDPALFTAPGGTWNVGPYSAGPPAVGMYWYFYNQIGSQTLISIVIPSSVSLTPGLKEIHIGLPSHLITTSVSGVGTWHDQNQMTGMADVDDVAGGAKHYIRLRTIGTDTFNTTVGIYLQMTIVWGFVAGMPLIEGG